MARKATVVKQERVEEKVEEPKEETFAGKDDNIFEDGDSEEEY